MKTIKKVIIEPVYVDLIDELEECKIYISKIYNTSVHLCLCGCKNKVVLPFNSNGWNLKESDKGISITPSIGNYNFDCKSHYIITNNVANFV